MPPQGARINSATGTGDELADRASAAVDAGEYQKAIDLYTLAMSKEPTPDATLHGRRSVDLTGLKRFDEAFAWNNLAHDTLSRSPPPPLPGGYKVGEKLYYIAETYTFDDGDRLVHGEQGEVIGPSPPGEFEGQLQIKIPNNRGIVQ